jgi:DNA-binding CsgD family transcriptional regulator
MLYINVFTFSIGIIVLTILWVFYMRNKQSVLLKYNLMMISFFATLCLDFIPNSYIFAIESNLLFLWINFLRGTFALAFIVSVPLFANSIFLSKYRVIVTKLTIILVLINLFFFIFVIFTPVGDIVLVNIIFHWFWSISMASAITYSCVVFILYYRNIKQEQLKSFIKFCAVISSLFLPFLIFRDFLYLDFLVPYLHPDFYFRTILFLLINIFTIIFFFRYYFAMIIRTLPETLHESYILKYNISPREKDVITLLIKGKSYKQISEKLFISLSTVKSHIYSVYKKSGTGNKTALIRDIQYSK